jgi:hypothetical protein
LPERVAGCRIIAGALRAIGSIEIGCGDGPPEVVGKMADQEFIDQVNGPKDIVEDQEDEGVVVVPTDQE